MDTNPSNAQPTAWRRGRSPRVAAQRGRQRRHLRRANHSRAARPTTQPAPGENLDKLNPAVKSFLEQAQAGFLQLTCSPVAARQMALQSLEDLRQQQSSALAYFDTFFVFAVVGVALSFLVLLMKPLVAAKGAHVAAE